MGQDLFNHLPSDIILNILSRLHVRTIMKCKCVCKPWLDLLTAPEFVKSHLSKSIPGLAVFLEGENSKPYKIVEFEDENRCNIVFNFDLPFHEPPHSSANGLLFLCNGSFLGNGDLHLCNPITRDYITIPSPLRQPSSEPMVKLVTYGFGVSRMSCQYKVVRVFNERSRQTLVGFVECQIYTVGTGSWRGITCDGPLGFKANIVGTFFNGNIHWLTFNGSSTLISCLDLETELFSTFSLPPLPLPLPLGGPWKIRKLSVLRDCLCVCVYSWQSSVYEIDIWWMKEYGDEKSWTKEFVIHTVYMDHYFGFICPIKVFKDGDILMGLRFVLGLDCIKLLYYSSKTNMIQESDDVFGLESEIFTSTINFAPSFLSLKTFAMENVTSF